VKTTPSRKKVPVVCAEQLRGPWGDQHSTGVTGKETIMKMISGAIVVLAGAVMCGGAAAGPASAGTVAEETPAFILGVLLGMGGAALLVWGIKEDSAARRASTPGQAALPPVQPPLQPGVPRADQERQQ
jgi:hypothetical protein